MTTGITNISCKWVDGDQVFYDSSGTEIMRLSNSNGFKVPSIDTPNVVKSVTVNATLAEINEGKVLLAGTAGKTIHVVGLSAKVDGTFGTVTSVEVEDTNDTPVVICSYAVAALSDGAVLLPNSANVTPGAGFMGDLTEGEGIEVTITGSDADTATGIDFNILYTQE